MGQKCSQPVNEIIPHLYLGNVDIANEYDFLKEKKIALIIDLSLENYKVSFPSIEHVRIPIRDKENSDILQYFDNNTKLIYNYLHQERNVLVHCVMGVSRSCSIVAAYLIRYYNMSRDDAIDFIQKRRSCVKPNPGFMQQLKEFEIQENKRKALIVRKFNFWRQSSLK